MQQVGNDVSTNPGLLTFAHGYDGLQFDVEVDALIDGAAEVTAYCLPRGDIGVQVYVAREQVRIDGGDLRAAAVRAVENEVHWYSACFEPA